MPSIFNDAVRLPNGDLMVVGHTLPFDANAKSIMGQVTSQFPGAFIWLRTFDEPGRDGFTRIVWNPIPENPQFNLYVLGTQAQPGGSSTTDDVVLLNLDANATFNFKKIYVSAADDEFGRELEVLSNGDMALAGNHGQGVIYHIDNSGNQFTGISIAGYTFVDVIEESPTVRYAVANEANGDVHVLKMDQDWLLLWDIGISDLLTVSQIWSDGQGQLFVTGTGNFNGTVRPVIGKLVENNLTDVSIKYLHTGSAFTDGSTWLMPNGQLAYADTRIIPGQFGQREAFISLSDTDFNTCAVTQETHDIIFFDPVPNGPVGPAALNIDNVNGVEVLREHTVWMEADVCNSTPCTAGFSFTHNNCGSYSFTGQATGIPPFTYSWNFGDPASGTANNTSALQNPIHQFSNSGLFTVVLTVTDGTGCMATWTVFINVPPLPVVIINANPGLNICQGESTTLTASTGAGSTFLWNTSATTSSIQVNTAGTYCVTTTDANGCTASDCVNVVVKPLPVISISGNTFICQGSSTTLTASGGGTYVWSPGGATTASITVTPLTHTTYTVTSTLNGCSSSKSVIVTVNQLPIVNIGPDFEICADQQITLNVSVIGGQAPITYLWTPGNVTTSTYSLGLISVTSTYTVLVTDGLGCTATDQITISVNPLPTVYAGPDQTICAGTFATLNATAGSGTPPYAYIWNTFWGQNPYSVSPGITQTYTVEVYDAHGCKATDQLIIDLMNCCQSSLVQNWEFTQGGTALGIDFIWSATNWEGIWHPGVGTNRNGDYWYLNSIIYSPPATAETILCYGNDPKPSTQGKYAGFTCYLGGGAIGKIFRQGILNNLSGTISPNSGFYKVSMLIACPCVLFGSPRLAVFGVNYGAQQYVYRRFRYI